MNARLTTAIIAAGLYYAASLAAVGTAGSFGIALNQAWQACTETDLPDIEGISREEVGA